MVCDTTLGGIGTCSITIATARKRLHPSQRSLSSSRALTSVYVGQSCAVILHTSVQLVVASRTENGFRKSPLNHPR